MPTPTATSGTTYLGRRSTIACRLHHLPHIEHAMLLGADKRSSAALEATLHLLFGYAIAVETATTIGAALDRLAADPPDLVILDDRLPPLADPVSSLAMLHSLGCVAPVVVLRSERSHVIDQALLEAGAGDVIDRGDLSASRLCESLLRLADAARVAAQ
jgi:CheY-like chemotaxis protein